MLLQPPALQPGSPARFEPATLALDDLQATAEFIVMAIEASRKDKLKQVDLTCACLRPSCGCCPEISSPDANQLC
jgi:hypothetical protein